MTCDINHTPEEYSRETSPSHCRYCTEAVCLNDSCKHCGNHLECCGHSFCNVCGEGCDCNMGESQWAANRSEVNELARWLADNRWLDTAARVLAFYAEPHKWEAQRKVMKRLQRKEKQ